MLVDVLQCFVFLFGVETVITNGPADRHVIFLFNKTVVVLSIWTAAGKGNLEFFAVVQQYIIDELSAVVGVHPFEHEGKLGSNVDYLLHHPSMSAIS